MWIWSVSLFEVVVGIFDPSLWDNIYMFYKRVYSFPMAYVNLDIKKTDLWRWRLVWAIKPLMHDMGVGRW